MSRFEMDDEDRKTWKDGFRYETRYVGRDENTPLPSWASHVESQEANGLLYVKPVSRAMELVQLEEVGLSTQGLEWASCPPMVRILATPASGRGHEWVNPAYHELDELLKDLQKAKRLLVTRAL